MNDYQKEQIESLQLIRIHLPAIKPAMIEALGDSMSDYLEFRAQTDKFLQDHFSEICTRNCYQNRLSACCSKDGIITFFADMVINVLYSNETDLDRMENRLQEPNTGSKCIYLTPDGCLWKIKPIVCQMFLCDKAEDSVLAGNASVYNTWETLKQRKMDFTWPDKPVLFDRIESVFLEKGHTSSLMYLHNSPGLLRVKQNSGIL